MKPPGSLFGIFLLLSIGVFVLLHSSSISGSFFDYDESDYMYAASKGILANYTDHNTISIITFLKKGFEKGQTKGEKQSLSEFIRSSDDIAFYRHYHAPLYFYCLSFWKEIFGISEYNMRWLSIVFHIFGFLAIYLGILLTLGHRAHFAAIVSSIFFLFSPANIITATKMIPHSLYVLVVIVSLFMMIKLVQTLKLKYWYLSIAALSLAFLTMEFAPLLLLTFVLSIFISRNNIKNIFRDQLFHRFILKSIGLFIAILSSLWIGGVLKLTILKNYLFFAYFTLVRNESYGAQSFFEVWYQRFTSSQIEYIILIIFIITFIFIALRGKDLGWIIPVLIYSVFMIIVTILNRSASPQYISSLLPALYIIAGITFSELFRSRKVILQACAAIAIVLTLFLNNRMYLSQQRISEYHSNEVVGFFQSNKFNEQSMLIPNDYIPNLHYYFPNMKIKTYNRTEIDNEGIVRRLKHERIDCLLYENSSIDVNLEKLLLAEYDLQKNNIVARDTSSTTIILYRLTQRNRLRILQ